MSRTLVSSIEQEYKRYKSLGDGALAQLADDQLAARGAAWDNSIATIVWHVAGNLESRFSDFLTSDGEKPWRNRESEFEARQVPRSELLAKWEKGWKILFDAVAPLTDEDLGRMVAIRAMPLPVHEALHRSLAHAAYHVGQIIYQGKTLRGADWTFLTIPPGGSSEYNQKPTMEKGVEATEVAMRLRTREWAFTAAAFAALGVSGPSARPDAQPPGATHAPTSQPARTAPELPFGVGEEMVYKLSAKWTLFRGGGSGSLKVEAIDTVRGFPTYRLVMRMKAGIAFYHIDDVHRSWLDVEGLFSRRFEQVLSQTTYDRDRTYEFLLDEGRYVDLGNPSDSGALASDSPLDDVSFVYHLRTMSLEVGKEYTEPLYYKDDGNPVTIRVLRKERIKVPAGEFDAIVVEPIIRREKSLFKEGEGEIWLSDDDRRLILKLRGKGVATLTMELQSFTAGAAAPTLR